MYLVMDGKDGASLICDDGKEYFMQDQYENAVDSKLIPLSMPLACF